MNTARCIGVFDSGVGGLSVLRCVRNTLPKENLIYIADSAHAPYGSKTRDFIEKRSIALSKFFLEQEVKAIVVACNTATAAAISTLRSMYAFPIIGMEPAVKPAIRTTRSGIIGVLATEGTLESEKFARLLERFGGEADVIIQPCPGLVEQVEGANFADERTRTLVEGYLAPLLKKGADTIVLGCTHYPFLISLIRDVAGPQVAIIETGDAVAREVRRRLEQEKLLSENHAPGTEQFWTSGPPDGVQKTLSRLWDRGVRVMRLPEAYAREV
ncbi:MAG: glutamate racemase [Pseudomonadota bacterium]